MTLLVTIGVLVTIGLVVLATVALPGVPRLRRRERPTGDAAAEQPDDEQRAG